MDNGPEFAGKVMDEWAYRRGIKLSFIRPGKPVENAYAESFNGRLRDECLNINRFMSVRHAREIIESWRQNYLSGEIPPELGNLVNLQSLWVFANRLSGCVPTSLRGQLESSTGLGRLPFC